MRFKRLSLLIAGVASICISTHAQAQVAQEMGYQLDYDLNIKAATAGSFTTSVPYTTDNSSLIATGSFTRVAYELTLSGSTNLARSPNGNVWVSFDTQSPDASKLGVPTTGSGEFYQQGVSNMNVIATAGSGVSNATGLANGNIQFWPSNYAPNSATNNFDWNNNSANGSQGYGSMQISQITNPNGSTGNMFLSFNNWSSSNNYDVGLGNNTVANGLNGGTYPDYTFSMNIGDYSSARLTVWVNTPEPASLGLLGMGTLGLLARRRHA